ncbi:MULTISPECIES: hypothetical protein [Microcystis]|uniref:hypothetical protein n=1 Tax=Microcystis TaxID=1125 RepID=UPI000261EDA4|nr:MULTISPECIES: hypothetical protein [Microcystis]MCZ8116817.1 hypothetical protein [Microcystis sp. LE18-22.4A]CCI30846.1 hypothetical protein MICAI_1450002 [Microcystis sp. T1-4]
MRCSHPVHKTIPDILNIILNHPLLQLRRDYKEQFINTDQYYIYSAVKTQVIAILLSDLKWLENVRR